MITILFFCLIGAIVPFFDKSLSKKSAINISLLTAVVGGALGSAVALIFYNLNCGIFTCHF